MSDLAAPLTDDSFYAGDPFPHYACLRAEAPVAWNEQGFWALSRHHDIAHVSTSSDFSSTSGILAMEIGLHYDSPPTMMHTDPPAHTRYRGLVAPGFRPSLMKALEDSNGLAAERCSRMSPLGSRSTSWKPSPSRSRFR